MLAYIREQIAEQTDSHSEPITFDDDIVLECAHVFSELDDLTKEGTDSTMDRPMSQIEIPLEDDAELENIEFNLTDGRVTDVPMDATVQEAVQPTMKTLNDFYVESYESMVRMPRESEHDFSARAMRMAHHHHDEYIHDTEKKGLFGFNKVDASDSSVPYTLNVHFNNVMKVVPIKYVCKPSVSKITLTKEQIKAVNAFGDSPAGDDIIKVLAKFLQENYPDETSKSEDVWSFIGSVELNVPRQIMHKDKFEVYISFNNIYFITDYVLMLKWVCDKRNPSDFEVSVCDKDFYKSVFNWKTKHEMIKESATIKRMPNRFDDDYYMESINFGDTDAGNKEETPTDVDNSDEKLTPDTTPIDETKGGSDKTKSTDDKKDEALPVDTNDVSDEIAEKVSEDTTENDADVTADIDNDDTSIDNDNDIPLPAAEEGSDDDIDNKLNDLNSDAGMSSDNFDDMTIDELIKKGEGKLKGMTISELKKFIDSTSNDDVLIEDTDMADTNIPDVDENVDGLTQEAFLLTNKNINKEMSDQLRVVSGILNNTEMSFSELVDSFKKEGKKLNKVLSKAVKFKKVYSTEEIDSINKLNSVVINLSQILKTKLNDNEVVMVKRVIKEFVSRATAVNEIIERVVTNEKTKKVSE